MLQKLEDKRCLLEDVKNPQKSTEATVKQKFV